MRSHKRDYLRLVAELGWTVDPDYEHPSHLKVTHPSVARPLFIGTNNPISLKACKALMRRLVNDAPAKACDKKPAASLTEASRAICANPFPHHPKTTNKMRRQRKKKIPSPHTPTGSFGFICR